MRTLIIILVGFVLWAAILGIGRLVSGPDASSGAWATAAFVAVWLLVAAANMWVGVARAGYSLREELPIFLLIFLVPVAVAVLAKWKFL